MVEVLTATWDQRKRAAAPLLRCFAAYSDSPANNFDIGRPIRGVANWPIFKTTTLKPSNTDATFRKSNAINKLTIHPLFIRCRFNHPVD